MLVQNCTTDETPWQEDLKNRETIMLVYTQVRFALHTMFLAVTNMRVPSTANLDLRLQLANDLYYLIEHPQ